MTNLRSSTTDKALARLDAKKKTAQQKKISKVMREFKAGELNNGSKEGPIVKTRKQAIAIALSEAGVKRKDAKEATIAKALAHADAFTLKRKYDVVVNLANWQMVMLEFAKPPEGQLKEDLGALLKETYSYNPFNEALPEGMPRPSTVSIYISKLYDCEEVAETIAAELERQGLKVLRRDDRAMPRSTVVTFAKLDALDTREDAYKSLKGRKGQPCDKNRGWHGLRGACQRAKKGADTKSLQVQSAQKLADKIRQQRGLTAVTREGSGQPLPFDRKSRQSASIAKATMSVKDRREKLRREFDPNSSGKRAEMIAKKEERRAIVGLGGIKKAMAEADAVAPEKPKLTVMAGGKASQDKALAKMSAGELFKEADRVGSKYQSPNDPIDLTARRQAAEILRETGVSKAIDRASGKGSRQSAPKPKTNQVAQLQALREAKIKNGTFKRSVDSIDRSFG